MKKQFFAIESAKQNTAPAVEDPKTELSDIEIAQEPIAPETEPEIEDAETLDLVGKTITKEVSDETEAIVSLESIAQYIASVGKMDSHAARFANMAIEGISEKVNLKSTTLCFSLESYDSNPQERMKAALEGIKEKVEELFSALKEKMIRLAKHIGEVIKGFNRNLVKLKAKVYNLETMLKKVSLDKPRLEYIKPERWCADLCYLDVGFDKGLKNIGKEVGWLIDEHTKMATNSTKKYVQWFNEHSKFAMDESPFKTLRVSKNDFLLPGMTEFNRSIQLTAPEETNMFYRSKELPGGKAFYTSVQTTDKVGRAGIYMLQDIDFFIKEFDPKSYKLQKANIAKLAGLGFFTWFFATGMPVAIIAGAASMAYMESQKVSGTGNKVTIPKGYMFETLSLSDVRNTISDLKSGITKLEKWNSDVLQKPWKTKDLDNAIIKIIGNETGEVYNGNNVQNLRNYCYALLNLMTAHTVGIHTYAFKVYNSMTNFSEKSLKQYI